MNVVTLPESEAQILRDLHTTDKERFIRRVRALRESAQWPLRAIGEPVGAPRSTVRKWVLSTHGLRPDPELDGVALPQRPVRSRETHMRLKVPPAIAQELASLFVISRDVSRFTRPDAPTRQAGERINELLIELDDAGVTPMEISRAANVTRRAVVVRLEAARQKIEKQAS